MGLDVSQKILFLWDAFKVQATNLVYTTKLDELNIECAMVSKNMTHLLELLDSPTNGAMKKIENHPFREYFTDCHTRGLLKDPGKGVTTIDVDLKLSTLENTEKLCIRYMNV